MISKRSRTKQRLPGTQSLLLVNIAQLVTVRSPHAKPRRGSGLGELGIIEDAAVFCAAGRIVAVGRTRDALRDPAIKRSRSVREIDCQGKVVLPGFVDSHTHPAFVAPRLVDFEKRIAGASYEEIGAAGGGIRSSIDAVRKASRGALAEMILDALRKMAEQGTTTVEAKSGYGLSTESEIKSLEAIRDAGQRWPGTVMATLLGAHVVPPEFANKRDEYLRTVCEQMIPQTAREKLALFVDVFCDQGAFTEEETTKIFAAAEANGLHARGHVSQLTRSRVLPLLKFHPASLDHMDCVDDEDVSALAKSDTVATLVPGANYFLGLGRYPPARQLIDAGVAVALATDFNPGTSPTPSMPLVLSLACTHMKMSPAEAITAATYNGACALRLQDRKGSIEPGKDADLAVFDVEDYREIAYWFGVNRCAATVLGGEVMSRGD
jgi:imidazolonepropionase